MPERDFVIVRFMFIFVRADSLQYLNLIMPERGIVIVCTIQCCGEPRSPFVLQTDYLPDHNCPTGQFHRPQGRFHLTKSDFTRHRRISPTFSGIILKK